MQGKVPRSLLFHSSFIEACRKKKKKSVLKRNATCCTLPFTSNEISSRSFSPLSQLKSTSSLKLSRLKPLLLPLPIPPLRINCPFKKRQGTNHPWGERIHPFFPSSWTPVFLHSSFRQEISPPLVPSFAKRKKRRGEERLISRVP